MRKLLFILVIITFSMGIFSGCVEIIKKNGNGNVNGSDTTEDEYISLEELHLHPNRYLNETIFVKAVFQHSVDDCYIISTGNYNSQLPTYIEIPETVDTYILVCDEKYIFKGVLGYGDFTAYDGKNGFQSSGLYFRIEAISLVYTDDSDITTLKKISQHPATYLNRTITVKAIIDVSFSVIVGYEYVEWSFWIVNMNIITNDVDTSMLIPDGEYYFTGMLKLESLHPSLNSFAGGRIIGFNFDVEKIEPI